MVLQAEMEDLRRQMQRLEMQLMQKQKEEVEKQRVEQSGRISDLATNLGSFSLTQDPPGASGSLGSQEAPWDEILAKLKAQEEALREAEEAKEDAERMSNHFTSTNFAMQSSLQAAEKLIVEVRPLALTLLKAFTLYSLPGFLHPWTPCLVACTPVLPAWLLAPLCSLDESWQPCARVPLTPLQPLLTCHPDPLVLSLPLRIFCTPEPLCASLSPYAPCALAYCLVLVLSCGPCSPIPWSGFRAPP